MATDVLDAPAGIHPEETLMARRPRSDSKPPEQKFSFRMAVKMTALAREHLHRLAVANGHRESDADFIRSLLDGALAHARKNKLRGVGKIPEGFTFQESE